MKDKFQEEQEANEIYERVGEMFNDPEFDAARKDATLKLLHILSRLVMEHPELRFGQILQNYGFVKQARPVSPEQAERMDIHWQNEFYLEPVALLKRVQARLDDSQNPKR